MTGLLVSVRDVREAQLAVRGGADLVDIKEPRNGSLGAASSDTWREVAGVMNGAAPLSAALGELLDPHQPCYESLRGFSFAKLGLAGCASVDDWSEMWQQALANIPRGTAAVAVVYADSQVADCPDPVQIIATASRLHCAAVLFDTFDKAGGPLTEHLTISQLATLLRAVRVAGMKSVLAGSLTKKILPQLMPLEPDFIAVRGAVCRGDRTGVLEQDLVEELAQWLHLHSHHNEPETTPKQFQSFA